MSSVESGAAPGPPPAADGTDLLDRPEAGRLALRGSVLRTAAYVAGILLSLASAPLLIRHLGVSQFGRYVTVISLVTIVAGLTEGGLNSVVLREYATLGPAERGRLMRSAIGIRTALTLVGVALAVIFAAVAGYGSTLVLGTAVAGLGLVLQLLQSVLSVALQSELRFGLASAADLLRQAVNVALLVVLVLVGAGLLPLLAVAVPASAASLLFTVAVVRGQTSLRPSYDFGRWWRLLRDSIPWAAISAVYVVYLRLAIVVMSVAASAQQTGYFATSFRVVEVLIGVPPLVVSAAFPILARTVRGDTRRFEYASGRLFELALLAGTWMVICIEVGAPFAIHVLAGHKAEPAITVLRIQGLAVVATFVAVACGFPLLTLRRYRAVLIVNLIALLLSPLLTVALVPALGARGGAIAAVVAEGWLAVGQTVLLMRAAPSTRLPLSAVPLAALAGGAAVAAGVALPVHPVIGVFVASAVYLAVLAAVGRFPAEVAEVLRSSKRQSLGSERAR